MLKITAFQELLDRRVDGRTPESIALLITLLVDRLELRIKLLDQLVKRCLLGSARAIKTASRFMLTPHCSHLLAEGRLTLIVRRRQGARISTTVSRDQRFLVADDSKVFRLLEDGSVDSTFKILTTSNGDIQALSLTPDGGVYVGGMFIRVEDIPYPGIVRLHDNGEIDPTFQPVAAGSTPGILSLAVQESGRILLTSRNE